MVQIIKENCPKVHTVQMDANMCNTCWGKVILLIFYLMMMSAYQSTQCWMVSWLAHNELDRELWQPNQNGTYTLLHEPIYCMLLSNLLKRIQVFSDAMQYCSVSGFCCYYWDSLTFKMKTLWSLRNN